MGIDDDAEEQQLDHDVATYRADPDTAVGAAAAKRIEAYLRARCDELLALLSEAQNYRHAAGLPFGQRTRALRVRAVLAVELGPIMCQLRQRWGLPGATAAQRDLARDVMQLQERLGWVQ